MTSEPAYFIRISVFFNKEYPYIKSDLENYEIFGNFLESEDAWRCDFSDREEALATAKRLLQEYKQHSREELHYHV